MQQNNRENHLEETGDINKAFDDILLIEEKIIEKSYNRGFQQGSSEDNLEGYHLGYHRGAELGAEIGHISGVVKFYLNHFEKEPPPEKILKTLTHLQKLLENFPSSNDPDVDIVALAEGVKAEFKKFCSQLNIDLHLSGDSLSF